MTEYIVQAADWAIDCNGDSLFKDAEEIVRCRDCRYYHPEIYKNLDCEWFYSAVEPDGFCKWGERRDA